LTGQAKVADRLPAVIAAKLLRGYYINPCYIDRCCISAAPKARAS